jgi:hypothetical protein
LRGIMFTMGVSATRSDSAVDRWRSPSWRAFYVVCLVVGVPFVAIAAVVSPDSWPSLALIVAAVARITLDMFRVSLRSRPELRTLLWATVVLGLVAAAWGIVSDFDFTAQP